MRVTGSKLALLSECGWWARDGVQWANRTSDAASFGTQLHACCEAIIEGRGAYAEDDAVLHLFRRVVEPWLLANVRVGWRAEVPFALDAFAGTARELPKGAHRDYSGAKADDVCMTLDACYMGEDADGVFACVDDFKWSGFHGDEAKAEAQLTGQALAVSLAYGVDRVRARAIRISENVVDDTSEVYWFGMFDLEAAREAIASALGKVASSEPKPGAHCFNRWCPASGSCPATTEAMAQVIPAESLARFKVALVPESPAHAAYLWPRLKLAEEWVEKAIANVKDLARSEPIDLGDGTELRETTQTRESASVEKLKGLAVRLGATPEQLAACTTGATFKQVRALKKRGGK